MKKTKSILAAAAVASLMATGLTTPATPAHASGTGGDGGGGGNCLWVRQVGTDGWGRPIVKANNYCAQRKCIELQWTVQVGYDYYAVPAYGSITAKPGWYWGRWSGGWSQFSC